MAQAALPLSLPRNESKQSDTQSARPSPVPRHREQAEGSAMAAADSQKQRVLCVRLPVFRFARKAVFAFTRHAMRAAE